MRVRELSGVELLGSSWLAVLVLDEDGSFQAGINACLSCSEVLAEALCALPVRQRAWTQPPRSATGHFLRLVVQ